MGPPSYMHPVVDRNVVMRRIPVFTLTSPRLLALQQLLVHYYIILYYITLHYIILYYIILHYIILHYIMWTG